MSNQTTGPTGDSHEGFSYASVLQECLVSAVIACDGAGKITAFSNEAENLTRLKPAQALGQSISTLPSALEKVFRKALASGKANIPDILVHLATTTHGTVSVRVHLTHIAGGGVIVALHDLSAARKLEQNMRRLDRLANIGTLSASLGHEVKNALVAVRTFVDLLLEKNPDAELSEVMGREMKRIDALLSQTLRVANPPKPRVAAVHVHEVLDHSLRLVQHQINEKLVSLQRRFDATSDVVNGDGYQLEQSFMNLMLNALEAMGANGELTIATEIVPAPGKNSAQLAISIRDTGIGVAPENMERLFETFFTTKQNGTGLGLAITRRIIHEHDGEITAQSQVHKGTTFRITLPLA